MAGLLQQDVRKVLVSLDEREQQVIRMHYGLEDGTPRTYDLIGKAPRPLARARAADRPRRA